MVNCVRGQSTESQEGNGQAMLHLTHGNNTMNEITRPDCKGCKFGKGVETRDAIVHSASTTAHAENYYMKVILHESDIT